METMKAKRLPVMTRIAVAAAVTAAAPCSAFAAAGPGEVPGGAGSVWLTYNNDYSGQRFSPLKEINAKNVSGLKEICRLPLSDGGSLQAGPVVADGSMFVTTALDTFAIDPSGCKLLWKTTHEATAYMPFPVNRGVAYMNGAIFRGTPDGHLVSMDAKTGKVLWDEVIADTSYGEFASAAPIAWGGVVYMGIAGSDWGMRGRIMAYDAATGRELWRFNTIPRGTEIGADTWKRPGSATIGGGGTWSSYTLDIRDGELFVTVGNPAQDSLPDTRPGDNLFTDSLVVLDARTGKLKWWYQTDKNDPWDYDLSAPAMLYLTKGIKDAVAVAGKDGYLYAVDRVSHKLMFKTAVTTQFKGGPKPTKGGTRACPGFLGGSEWNGPAYDANNHQIVVGAVDWCSIHKVTGPNYERGQLRYGADLSNEKSASGWITAVDAESGTVKWKYHTEAPVVAAVTPTAGGITFSGDTAGNFLALDSSSGALLWSKKVDGALGGGIITYSSNGKQFVATLTGNVSRLTFGGDGVPSVVIWGL
ncbi:pyrroloquinoline quinone-dependent dehydrogenase [Trinickia sp. EG282A]|uniref:pyrroloquinoline quinone-dependent dehydrogenase n=1 Tax=Trinickia sp. EG282A TaxID=3237013 RepID=UPI0034D36666